jgi:chromosome segregation ATPase
MDPPELGSTGIDHGSLDERLDSLATWMSDIEARVRATEFATGDERTAKELRKAIEMLSKHDPKLEKRITDHMAVLADRFETLASTVSHTAAALAAKDGEIAALRRELESAGKRIEELGGDTGRGVDAREIARLRSMIDAVAAQRPLRASDSRVDELGSRVRLLADRVDSMGATVGAAAATLGRREGDLAILRERLDAGASQIEGLTVELRRLHRDGDLLQQLDALNAALEATNGRLVAREKEAAALRSRIDEAYAQVGSVVTEMQRALGGLANQVAALETLPEATAAALEGRAAELGGKVDAVDQRLEAVSAQVEAGLRDMQRRDHDLASLHGDLEAQRAHVDAVAAEMQRAIGGLANQVAALETLPEATAAALEGRAAELGGKVDAVDRRLEAVSAQVEAGLRDMQRRDHDLASLHGELDAQRAHVDAVVGSLRTELEALPDPQARDPELDARLHELGKTAAHIASRLEEVAADAASNVAASASRETVLEEGLDKLSTRLDSVEQEHDAAAAELRRADKVLLEERDWVRRQLERLTDAQAEATEAAGGVQPELGELRTRLGEVEAARDAAASEIVRISHALDSERGTVQAQLGALAAQVADAVAKGGDDSEVSGRLAELERREAAAASHLARATAAWTSKLEVLGARVDGMDAARDPETESLVHALAARLDASERECAAAASELASAAETWAAERASLCERIQDVSAKLARVESAAQGAAAAAAVAAAGTPDDGVAELRACIDGLRMKVASSEKDLATLAGAGDAGVRLDELARRLEAVERAGAITILPDSDLPLAGDGRLRLELRSVELRMEHAEAAARENREAVLTQLERLASRVEWRLQRLENAQEGYIEPVETGAQIVPIRGGAD